VRHSDLECVGEETQGRNDALYWASRCFKELVAEQAIEVGAACVLLLRASEMNGYVAKDGIEAAQATIMSGLGLREWPEGIE
jgi:hypothetical protein